MWCEFSGCEKAHDGSAPRPYLSVSGYSTHIKTHKDEAGRPWLPPRKIRSEVAKHYLLDAPLVGHALRKRDRKKARWLRGLGTKIFKQLGVHARSKLQLKKPRLLKNESLFQEMFNAVV